MERRAKRAALAALVVVTLAGCGGGASTPPGGADANADWMDGAVVQVVNDAAAGRQRVTLRDQASGTTAVVDDEPLTEGAVEFDGE